MSSINLPTSVKKFAKFDAINEHLEKLFANKNIFHELLQFVLGSKMPEIPVRKTQIVLNYKNLEVTQEPERTVNDEKQAFNNNNANNNNADTKNYVSKFSSDYLTYHMNSIVSEESELRMTTYDLNVLDNHFESLRAKRYGFLPLTVHARDTPNANQHYLLVILDYKTDKFYLFDSRNSNDYLYRSKDLPKDALEQLMIGLTQYKPFKTPFQYVPMAEWLGNQLQVVVHRNKWDSIYSLAWCLLVACWLDGSDEVTPESLMIELNNTGLELDKQNFIHNFAQSVLYNYRDFLDGAKYIRKFTTNLSMSPAEHKATKAMWIDLEAKAAESASESAESADEDFEVEEVREASDDDQTASNSTSDRRCIIS